ncbi:MAG TPA: protease modulator HflK, partial [Methylomirabilota bacterium]|nr:protease modulator HflK [Methylomirabilota bacterium]
LRHPAVAMSLFAVSGLILFLLGRYSGGIARLQKERLLRPSASYLTLCAYISFILAAALAGVQMGYPKVDVWVARALVILIGLIAIETLVNLILEMYRPRVRGIPPRVVYESRVIGLLGQPEGLITTAAQALDYQFGFKVSETWFYRFLERAFAWLLLLQFVALALSTCVIFVAPGEKALMERFGRPLTSKEPLGPGLHFKMPWPVDIAYRYRTDEIQSFTVGVGDEEEHEEEAAADDGHGHAPTAKKKAHGDAHGDTIVWTVGHYQDEFNMLVASRDQMGSQSSTNEQGVPVDLLSVSIPVQYQISDIYAWAYNHVNAGDLLERVGTREVVKYLVSVDLFDIMSTGRAKAANDLRERIQKAADERQLGVKILMVGLEDIHPPVKVAPAFETVVATQQENEAKIRTAEGYAARRVALASAEATEKIAQAQMERESKVVDAVARAARFRNQVGAYRTSPDVFTQRAYLQALSTGLTNSRKYVIVSTNSSDVIQFDLSEKIKGGLFDESRLTPAK